MVHLEQLSGTQDLTEIKNYWETAHRELISLPLEKRTNEYFSRYSGFIVRFQDQIPKVIKLLEDTATSLVGAILTTPTKEQFTITMLEIYADGIWDESGDYIKEIFRNKSTIAERKMKRGPMLYYYGGRLDIKVFEEHLPFSFLIRNLRRSDGSNLSAKKFGSAYPKPIYEKLFGVPPDFFSESTPEEEFLLDGNHRFQLTMPKIRLKPTPIKRILNGSPTGLSGLYKHCNWNFSI